MKCPERIVQISSLNPNQIKVLNLHADGCSTFRHHARGLNKSVVCLEVSSLTSRRTVLSPLFPVLFKYNLPNDNMCPRSPHYFRFPWGGKGYNRTNTPGINIERTQNVLYIFIYFLLILAKIIKFYSLFILTQSKHLKGKQLISIHCVINLILVSQCSHLHLIFHP